jgi:cytidylate kinase
MLNKIQDQRDPSSLIRVVAIDGPAGSGKSTVARRVAARLDFAHVDTGGMYRALALRALRAGAADGDESAVTVALAGVEFGLEGDHVILDGEDVSAAIRSAEVTALVPRIAAMPGVRAILLERQRALAASGEGVVMEGRDIGSVVFPDARWKFYLDARPEVRARRRLEEVTAAGRTADLATMIREIEERDRKDRERPVAPLVIAPGARVIDSSALTIEEVVDRIVERVRS